MEALIGIIVIVVLLIAPIKIAANYVGARNTGIFMCIIALIFSAAIQTGVSKFIPQLAEIHPVISVLVALLLSGLAYMLVLGTTYLKGIVIAIIQVVLTYIIAFIIGLLGLGISLSL